MKYSVPRHVAPSAGGAPMAHGHFSRHCAAPGPDSGPPRVSIYLLERAALEVIIQPLLLQLLQLRLQLLLRTENHHLRDGRVGGQARIQFAFDQNRELAAPGRGHRPVLPAPQEAQQHLRPGQGAPSLGFSPEGARLLRVRVRFLLGSVELQRLHGGCGAVTPFVRLGCRNIHRDRCCLGGPAQVLHPQSGGGVTGRRPAGGASAPEPSRNLTDRLVVRVRDPQRRAAAAPAGLLAGLGSGAVVERLVRRRILPVRPGLEPGEHQVVLDQVQVAAVQVCVLPAGLPRVAPAVQPRDAEPQPLLLQQQPLQALQGQRLHPGHHRVEPEHPLQHEGALGAGELPAAVPAQPAAQGVGQQHLQAQLGCGVEDPAPLVPAQFPRADSAGLLHLHRVQHPAGVRGHDWSSGLN